MDKNVQIGLTSRGGICYNIVGDIQMKEIRKESKLYDKETGEVYCKYNNKLPNAGLIFESGNKMFRKKFYKKNPDLSKTYLGNWLLLMDYLEQNTNRLVERKLDKDTGWLMHRPLTKKRMQDILDISSRSLRRFLKECSNKGYIRASDGEYYMSPLYALNGWGVSVELFLKFRDVEEINKAMTDKDKTKVNIFLGIDVEENLKTVQKNDKD